jgi:hypothetical protein
MAPAAAVLAPVGFAARLVYFLLAPFVLIAAGRVFPVWGAAINLGLVLLVFFTAGALRRWADSSRLVRALFGRQLALEEYYRERPPRPFLYYVLYPLLAPYWLLSRAARREFTLFKGYSFTGVALIAVLAGVDYARNWAPDIAFKHFAAATIATIVVQLVLVLAILMPVATSIITYSLARERRRLAVLFVAAVLSTALGVAATAAMNERIPQTVRARIHFRTDALQEEARAARLDAIRAAALAGGAGASRDAIQEAARDALRSFYRPDEVRGFRLFANRWGGMIYCPGTSRRPPIWVAMRTSGGLVEDASQLPPEARRLIAPP